VAVTDHISAADVLLDLPVGSKRQLLERLAAEAAKRLGRPAETILAALKARENLGSTALGRGVALPHARLDGTHPPLMLFARLRTPVDYDARDEVPVDLVILVLWPEAEPEGFLPTLAEACRALRAPQVLRRLRAATTEAELAGTLARHAASGDAADDE
jgi:PTS system nitrogen regulatory IIA component